MVVFAPLALLAAVMAEIVAATTAATDALVTHLCVAASTEAALVGIDVRAAVAAGCAVPAVELDVRARLVVGQQDLADDQREVVQSAFDTGGPQHGSGLSFAEPVIHHMGVGYPCVGARRVGGKGHHLEVGLIEAELLPVEADHERAEADPVQLNRVGRHQQHVLLEVDLELGELVVDRPQVPVERSGQRGLGQTSLGPQAVGLRRGDVGKVTQGTLKTGAEPCRRGSVIASAGVLGEPHQPRHRIDWQRLCKWRRHLLATGVGVGDRHGGPPQHLLARFHWNCRFAAGLGTRDWGR